MKPLRIAVADDERDMRDYFARILPVLGHEVVAVAEHGRQLVEACATTDPDLVITDIKMGDGPQDIDGIEAAGRIFARRAVPVILVSAFHDPELIERAEQDHALAYLVKPIKQADLETAIALSMRRFAQFRTLEQEATDLRQALEDRKLIERAKGILMRKAGLDEHEAFRRLQKISRERNLKLRDIAQTMILSEEMLGGQ
jgi:AmiR/NasT family two-component response regulator